MALGRFKQWLTCKLYLNEFILFSIYKKKGIFSLQLGNKFYRSHRANVAILKCSSSCDFSTKRHKIAAQPPPHLSPNKRSIFSPIFNLLYTMLMLVFAAQICQKNFSDDILLPKYCSVPVCYIQTESHIILANQIQSPKFMTDNPLTQFFFHLNLLPPYSLCSQGNNCLMHLLKLFSKWFQFHPCYQNKS